MDVTPELLHPANSRLFKPLRSSSLATLPVGTQLPLHREANRTNQGFYVTGNQTGFVLLHLKTTYVSSNVTPVHQIFNRINLKHVSICFYENIHIKVIKRSRVSCSSSAVLTLYMHLEPLGHMTGGC